jgi:hypothetical protein
MLIMYKATGHSRDVPDHIGSTLVQRGIATDVTPVVKPKAYRTRQLLPEAEAPPAVSERTGKPKRKYKRRDMRAED